VPKFICIGFYVPCSKPIPCQRIPIFLRVLFNDTNVYITIYWLTINKKEDTGKRGRQWFPHSGVPAQEQVMNLSLERLRNE
jgi:hypothetical protein